MFSIGSTSNTMLGEGWAQQDTASPASQPLTMRSAADLVQAPAYPAGPAEGAPPPQQNAGADSWFSPSSSGLGGVMASFYSAIQNLFAEIQGALNGTPTPGQGAGQEQRYATATASSLGDPHLSFNGTTANGNTRAAKWENMQGHADLLDSDSVAGGFTIATTATAPGKNGVTYNQSATITTQNGATTVGYADGALTLTEHGQSVALTEGQSLDLGSGERVSSNADGSATVTQDTGSGSIVTTLQSNRSGVDVSATATGVDLGGYLATRRGEVAIPDAAAGTNW